MLIGTSCRFSSRFCGGDDDLLERAAAVGCIGRMRLRHRGEDRRGDRGAPQQRGVRVRGRGSVRAHVLKLAKSTALHEISPCYTVAASAHAVMMISRQNPVSRG